MTRDNTLEQRIETTLYTAGVTNSGEIASLMAEQFAEEHEALVRELDDLKAFVKGMANNALKAIEAAPGTKEAPKLYSGPVRKP